MTEIAEGLGVERATISKNATSFCWANSLNPSMYMKDAEVVEVYTERRIESIARQVGKRNGKLSLPAVPSRVTEVRFVLTYLGKIS